MIAGTARGFRDILPKEALARERICATVRDCFADHGYLPVETPLLEDRASLERGGRIKNTPFQLFDADGNLLMLRPDLTLPVARLVAGHIRDEELPARFRYNAPVVREQQSLRGQPRQFTQLGIELVGTDGAASEVEVVSLLAEVMETLEVPAWRLVFGSVTPLTGLLSNCSPSVEFSAQVLALVHDSDLVSLDELVDATPELKPSAARALHAVPRMHGGVEVIDAIDALLAEADVPPAERGTAELKALVGALAGLFAEGRASFDFSIINSFDYYTGIIFKGYAEGIAASLASGGRCSPTSGARASPPAASRSRSSACRRSWASKASRASSPPACAWRRVRCASPCPRVRCSRTRCACSPPRACPPRSSPTPAAS